MYTKHAIARMKQRGISKLVVEMVINYGKEFYHDGAFVYLLSKQAIKNVIKNGIKSKIIDKSKNVYVVICDGNIVTVAHKTKHFRR